MELNPRKLAPSLFTSGVNKTINVGWSASDLATTSTDVATFTVDYPCWVKVNWSWTRDSTPAGFQTNTSPTGYIQLILVVNGVDVMVVSASSPILPGTYKLRVCTTAGSATDQRLHTVTIKSSASVTNYSLYNSFGTRIGL